MEPNGKTIGVALALVVVSGVVATGGLVLLTSGPAEPPQPRAGPPANQTDTAGLDGIGADGQLEFVRFESEREFEEYVERSRGGGYAMGGVGAGRAVEQDAAMAGGDAGDGGARTAVEATTVADAGRRATQTQTAMATQTPAEATGGDGGDGGEPSRVSDTNVQVEGIAEPDILKSDGQTIYYAQRPHHVRGEPTTGRPAPTVDERVTRIVDASSPANPAMVGNVSTSGRLFLDGDRLIVVGNEEITAVNVSDPASPERLWSSELQGHLVSARMLNGSMYLVVRQGVDPEDPCPIEPLGEDGPSIGCTDVYRPTGEAEVDATYTTLQVDPDTGTVEDNVSVVGGREHTATYVSENGVYLTFVQRGSRFDLVKQFVLSEESEDVPFDVRQRIREIASNPDLSEGERMERLGETMEDWFDELDDDQRREVRRDFARDFRDFLSDHRRELQTTGIVRVDVGESLSIGATGEVPGQPLNQFSLSEADGHLRIATTVGRNMGMESTNDLYVLNDSLDRVGSVQGMADGQRIYAVRYVGDTAYVVTFRQVDPFHVIDVSDPTNPEELGQVRLPGFSEYLHPLGDQRVLGIGREDGQVKATIFDASNPTDPEVQSELILDASFSAISETHHAFLLDRRHGVFFLPASNGGYVISYEDGLERTHRIDTDGPATRAMYIDDYMYVFSRGGLVVVNETDWSRADSIDFTPDDDERRPGEPPADELPSLDLDWWYDEDAGALNVFHGGGDLVDGDQLVVECGSTEVEVAPGTYTTGDRLAQVEACDPGEEAVLLWTSDDGSRTSILGRFEVGSDE